MKTLLILFALSSLVFTQTTLPPDLMRDINLLLAIGEEFDAEQGKIKMFLDEASLDQLERLHIAGLWFILDHFDWKRMYKEISLLTLYYGLTYYKSTSVDQIEMMVLNLNSTIENLERAGKVIDMCKTEVDKKSLIKVYDNLKKYVQDAKYIFMKYRDLIDSSKK